MVHISTYLPVSGQCHEQGRRSVNKFIIWNGATKFVGFETFSICSGFLIFCCFEFHKVDPLRPQKNKELLDSVGIHLTPSLKKVL